MLSCDLLGFDAASAFVLLETSSRRQSACVQRLKISDDYIVWLLERLFGSGDRSALLFAGAPSAYRSRWGYLMNILQGPKSAKLTPGRRRGGGAVESYRRGFGVSEIQGRMRLKNQATLESYLQGVAALSALTQLSPTTLQSVRSCAAIFPHLR